MQIYFALRQMPIAVAALIAFAAAGCATTASTSPPASESASTTSGGESYVGAYKDGLRSGQGTYTWPDGRKYVGAFRDGLPNGRGIYTLPNGETFVGEFQDNRRTKGTYSWPDGRQYVGPFRDDKPDGAGTYTWPDGKKYVGDFRAGSAEGQGVYTWPDGRRYVGALRGDLPNGKGTLTLGDGRKFAGEFRDGDYLGTNPVVAASAVALAEIPLERRGGTFIVPVLINDSLSLDFYLDSGSADVTVPAATFEALRSAGTIRPDDIIGTETYLMANGSTKKATIFRIRSLKVGSVVLQNVRGSLSQTGPPLLGMSFLGRFSSWSVDNARSVLVLK
jgi:clan AA aspartic protease (TIGR02281 family)